MRSLFCRTQATVLLLLFLSVLSARAAESSRRDGNWWRQLSQIQKVNYIVAFSDGRGLGYTFSIVGLTTADGKPDVEKIAAVTDSYLANVDILLKRVTTIQISDGLDKLYEDYRNRSIGITNAVLIVLHSIAGKSEQEMRDEIEYFRKHAL